MLERLGIPFETLAPNVDETPLPDEKPAALVTRLARLKAQALSVTLPADVIVGSDQVAECDGEVLGKPGSVKNACRQLAFCSGKSVTFLSAVHICCAENDFSRSFTISTCASFRELSTAEISRYVDLDQPLDCAGSFKSECAGSSLLRSMNSDDPTAIIGLPLIALSQALREAGFRIP